MYRNFGRGLIWSGLFLVVSCGPTNSGNQHPQKNETSSGRDINELGLAASRANFAPDRLIVGFAKGPDAEIEVDLGADGIQVHQPAGLLKREQKIKGLAGVSIKKLEMLTKAEIPSDRMKRLSDKDIDAWKNRQHLAVISLEAGNGQRLQEVKALLEKTPGIEFVDFDYFAKPVATANDPSYSVQWGLPKIGAPLAWDFSTGSEAIVSAVIDSGIDLTHPDIKDTLWTNPNEIPGNGIDDDANGYIDDVNGWNFVSNNNQPQDDNSHGTHCAGIMGARGNNGIGGAGVTWNVRVMALKVLGADGMGSYSNMARAINYAAAMGAKYSNNSYGGTIASSTLATAISNAKNLGHLLLMAAGNNGTAGSLYPAAYGVTYDNVISVGASQSDDQKASFSNYGADVHLAAPGVSIYATLPGGGYGYKSGTSMATPFVAGAAGVLWSINPNLSYRQVRDRLLGTVDIIPALSGLVLTSGRLNVGKAASSLTSAQRFTISASAGTGGSLSPGGDVIYFEGDNAVYSVVPSTGYMVSEVLVDGASVGAVNSYTFPNLRANHTIRANFVPTPVSLSMSDLSFAEGSPSRKRATADTVVVQIPVRLSGPAASSVSVNYRTTNGTALAGSDFDATSGRITIPAGSTSANISLTVIRDKVVEPNEVLYIDLDSPSGATISKARGTITINNDD